MQTSSLNAAAAFGAHAELARAAHRDAQRAQEGSAGAGAALGERAPTAASHAHVGARRLHGKLHRHK